MDPLFLESTKSSPEVRLMPDGNIKITGRSISETIVDFYKPVGDWINEYIKMPADVTRVDVNLEYFNSASSKILINLCFRLTHVQLKHKKLVINWYYEDGDEDIREKGEYFSSVLNIPFNFIKID
jgi:hypothetical protein